MGSSWSPAADHLRTTACASPSGSGMSEERLLPAERTAELVLLPPGARLPADGGAQPRPLCLAGGLPGSRRALGRRLDDPLQRDVARLRRAAERTQAVLRDVSRPALRATRPWPAPFWRCARHAACRRPRPRSRRWSDHLTAVVRRPAIATWSPCRPPSGLAAAATAPSCPARSGARSVPRAVAGGDGARGSRARASPRPSTGAERHRRARRRELDSSKRSDPLTLINKGEYLLLAAEAVDVSRPDDDEDPDAARQGGRGHGRADARQRGSQGRRAASA